MAKLFPLSASAGSAEQAAWGDDARSYRKIQLLRLAAVAFAAWLVSLPITIASGSTGAVFGALFVPFLLDKFYQTGRLAQFRLSAAITVALLLASVGLLIATVLRNGSELSELLSASALTADNPLALYSVGEFIAGFALAAAVCGSLHLLSQRGGAGRLCELTFIACAIVFTLTAHRNGMIDRPFMLGDFALIRGYDPAYLLMGIGTVSLLVLTAINLQEANKVRAVYHLATLAAVCLLLIVFVSRFGLPTPELTNNLGLTGQQGNGGQEDNPFQDSTNDPKDKAAPVAVVVFHDDYEPVDGSYYFRESAYSQFNGQRLDYATRADMDTDLLKGFDRSTDSRDSNTEQSLDYAISPLPDAPRRAVRTTIGTLVPHRSPFGLDTPTAFKRIPNPNATRFDNAYEAISHVPLFEFDVLLGRKTGNKAWSDDVAAQYLTLPDDKRYAELAASITAPLKPEFAQDDFARAWTIKRYLDENGIYSLKNAHAAEPDPAASFLFGDLTGYCVHFAFSAVYLYRSLGIPARVGVGYSVPASNRAGGSSLLIQAIHGHAWPEVYFEDVGWVIIDPAPQQTLVDMTTDPQDNLQQLLGEMLRNDSSFEQFMNAQRESTFDPLASLRQIGRYLAIVAALIVMFGYLAKIQRRFAPRFGAGTRRSLTGYRATLDRLADVGLRREFGESREAFAARCASYTPGLTELTSAHLAATLGAKDSTTNLYQSRTKKSGDTKLSALDWDSLERSVRSELQTNFPLWRRLLGALHPFSWSTTR